MNGQIQNYITAYLKNLFHHPNVQPKPDQFFKTNKIKIKNTKELDRTNKSYHSNSHFWRQSRKHPPDTHVPHPTHTNANLTTVFTRFQTFRLNVTHRTYNHCIIGHRNMLKRKKEYCNKKRVFVSFRSSLSYLLHRHHSLLAPTLDKGESGNVNGGGWEGII